MRETYLEAKFEKLLAYPEHCFGEPASERWLSLCSSLSKCQIPSGKFAIERDRKWELVSALQKAIRRADKSTALRVISGTVNMPEEYAYFLRRLCVIACEDVGPSDDTLVKFVIACATMFSTQKPGPENFRLLRFLVQQMCDVPIRSRIYCSYEILSHATEKMAQPRLRPEERMIVDAIFQQKQTVNAGNTRLHEWQKQQSWRTAGLLKFVGFSLPLESHVRTDPLPAYKTIFDLPSYCYDMYTRVGLTVLRRLVHGVPGAHAIRDFFHWNSVRVPSHKVLGEALFTVEGGREKCELVYPLLCSLEQRVAAHQFGLPFDQWLRLCDLTLKALERGLIDRLREEVLRRQYGQEKLPLVCQ